MNKPQLSLLAGLLLSSTAYSAPYIITDLGELSEDASFAMAVNNNGLTVGDFQGAIDAATGLREFETHGFSFDGTTFVDLGTLSPDFTTLNSSAIGINDLDQIIGVSQLNVSEDEDVFELGTQGFIYENGTMTALGLPETIEGIVSSAIDINNSGIIAGYATVRSDAEDETSAFLDQAVTIDPAATGDSFTLLGSLIAPESALVGRSTARAINDLGQIVGWSDTEEDGVLSNVHSFFIDPLNANEMIDAGTLGGNTSRPKDINNSGVMVGRAQLEDGTFRAFKFDIANDSSLVSLGTLLEDFPESIANAINENNQIVGLSVSGPVADPSLPVNPTRAVLFENDEIIDLNEQIDCPLGWTLVVATDINNAGQIVGSGIINGKIHGFLLTPDPTSGPVEPCEDMTPESSSSGGTTGFGLLLLLLIAVRQRFRLD